MNKVILMGRLTQDPELRHTTTGKAVCHFRLAVNRRFSRQGEQEQADFFPIVAWEKTGEFCNNYFRKGQQVAIIGRLQNRSWNDEQGNKRTITEIIADEAYFADSKKDNYTSGGFEPENTDGEGFFPAEDDELPF
ncbi:MAG TPA: single-stranded DNA-binding protein [Hungateiclostridium thermocellum]|uniref:Single-stranded DNA-binding protein n=1 Tax=Acetivibrio thermocellus (strain ATCC 27405 / DSM 1237 / JCM 9322 / NBRC 103400 / NCIMB 10682 / NRRL B-4536 / VPI 7372) TaxID=203119 RepID=A3DF53_ACET2|nr:single-stranded DNA-binding protein [Acetivibrio thermocellus]ABN52582.1 single-strand binding protein [Acetivibrio thermocellus ATCC 27405]HBW28123.1 single-stranded DNA-binding protein [Acetivibrio thermocellus]